MNKSLFSGGTNHGCHIAFPEVRVGDEYSKAERHMKFIEGNKENWKKVRVFDSYLEP
ncbi:MAG: hypothetical protein WCJ35_21035 [Planctomycetota bacterium]